MPAPSLREILKSDLYRLDGECGRQAFIRSFLGSPCFRYITLFRLCQHLKATGRPGRMLALPLLFWFSRISVRYGLRIPLSCKVGAGLYLAHWGSIWVNPDVEIGENCTIAHEVTLGRASRGPTEGSPIIGDRVYIGPGAKVVGRIRVGNDALIAANSLVIQDVPDHAMVMGVPARVFSQAGSGGYVTNILRGAPEAR